MDFPFLGFVFWAGIFTWFIVLARLRYLKEVERQKTLRAFAERGQPLDADLLEKLMPKSATAGQGSDSPEAMARGLLIGGIVTASIAVGLAIGAQIIGYLDHDALFGMSGAAAIVGSAGLGLLISALVTRRQAAADRRALLEPHDGSR
jgi:hypothetical protein